jgi:hypothetical protein
LLQKILKQNSLHLPILQIYDHSVKCQKCGVPRTKNDRVAILQKRIKWIENYSRGNNRSDEVKALKQELAELLS